MKLNSKQVKPIGESSRFLCPQPLPPLNLCIRTLAIDQHRENLSSFAQEESLLRPRNPLRPQGRDGKLSQVGQASLPSFIESQTQQNV